MNDQNGLHRARANGEQATDTDDRGYLDSAVWSFDGDAIDERLDGLLQTIRSWDWRAASSEAGVPGADESLRAVSETTVMLQEPFEDPTLLASGAAPVQDTAEPQSVVLDSMPTPAAPIDKDAPAEFGADSEAVSEETMPPSEPPLVHAQAFRRVEPPAPEMGEIPFGDEATAPAETREAPERASPVLPPDQSTADTQAGEFTPFLTTTAVSAPPQDHGTTIGNSASWFELEYAPEPKPEPDRPAGHVRSRSRVKVFGLAALCLLLAGALAFGGVRLFDKSPKSTGPTRTTHNSTVPRAAHPGHVVPPLTTAQLSQYKDDAATLQTANVAAAQAFDKAGTPLTIAQLALVDVAYRTALTSYNNDLHELTWSPSMQGAIEADQGQLRALFSFLESFAIVQPSGVSAWLMQLHNRTGAAQTADNQVRQDLGLPSSSSFP